MAAGSGGEDHAGAGRAVAGGAANPAEAMAVVEGPAPEIGSTSVVALPSKGQGEADILLAVLVLRVPRKHRTPKAKRPPSGPRHSFYAEPGQAPDTIETRLFPDETGPYPPVTPDPPRQMLPAWIRLILKENR